MARSRSVFLYCMAAALHNPALSSLSSRDAGSRYADLSTAENPNLPSVSPFRRMMDDAGRPTEGFTLVAPFLARRTRFSRNDSSNESREYFFTTFVFYNARDINTCILFQFFLFFKNCIYLPSLNTQAHLCRNLGIKIYI